MVDSTQTQVSYPPEFLSDVDKFIHLANEMAKNRDTGEVSAAILFAAGRYNSFNFLAKGRTQEDQPAATAFYTEEYRKAFESNLNGVVGPVIGRSS
ncbi:MAG TPA: hypothetical protein DCP03_08545 [Polaromonas sp.]|uniref:DUF3144 domain-containing protein n=1 Tax=Polaromonas sp. UBA4122 TaxID=1947074 RepID=UPI000ECFE860|nr:DUF3144 domain-containing protein [Polaromonas sp. UBA4122]HAL38154.1 hypothetical protein [Polaromonas sp.]